MFFLPEGGVTSSRFEAHIIPPQNKPLSSECRMVLFDKCVP